MTRHVRAVPVLALAAAFAGCAGTSATVRERIRAGFGPPETTLGSRLTIPEQRTAWEKSVAQTLPAGVTSKYLEGARGLMLTHARAAPGRLVIHFHGGGFVVGSSRTHMPLGAQIALQSHTRVLLVDYRLAPEHPFPAARDDAVAAIRWARSTGIGADQIVVSGDSAGGHVALTALLELRAAGEALPSGLVLLSPWLDLAQRGESMRSRAAVDPQLLEEDLKQCASLYLAGRDALSPELNPLEGDLAGLPPALVQVGDEEILLSDSTRFAERMRAAGGDTRLHVWPRLWHVFQSSAPELPEANEAIGEIAAFIERRTGS